MITGQEKPDSGEIVIGPTVQLSYVDQSRDKLEGNHNVFQEIAGGLDILNINGIEIQSRAYIGRFNFRARTSRRWSARCPVVSVAACTWPRPCCRRQRAAARRTVQRPGHRNAACAGRRAAGVPGNTFVISHDRWFLDRIATHIIAFEGDSHVEFFQGNYREYEEDKKRRMGDDAAPKRLRFKALKKKNGRALRGVLIRVVTTVGRTLLLRDAPCPCSNACSSCSTAPPCAPSCWPVSPPS